MMKFVVFPNNRLIIFAIFQISPFINWQISCVFLILTRNFAVFYAQLENLKFSTFIYEFCIGKFYNIFLQPISKNNFFFFHITSVKQISCFLLTTDCQMFQLFWGEQIGKNCGFYLWWIEEFCDFFLWFSDNFGEFFFTSTDR